MAEAAAWAATGVLEVGAGLQQADEGELAGCWRARQTAGSRAAALSPGRRGPRSSLGGMPSARAASLHQLPGVFCSSLVHFTTPLKRVAALLMLLWQVAVPLQ